MTADQIHQEGARKMGRRSTENIIYKRLPMSGKVYIYSVGDNGSIIKTSRKQYIETTVKPYFKRGKLTVKIANKEYTVKHLVAAAFLDGYKKGMSVCHKDGNPNNCAADNLVIVGRQELGRLTGGDSGRKPVIYNGVEYYSIRECAKVLYCSRNTLLNHLAGNVKNSVLDGIDVKYAN